MSLKQLNILLSTVLLVLCAIFYKATLTIREPADIYPKALIIIIAALSVMLLIQTIFLKEDSKVYPFAGLNIGRVLPTIVCTIVYYFGVKYIGFYVSSFIYMIVLCMILEADRNLKKLLQLSVMSVVIVLIIYLGFDMFLEVPTPKGLLF